MMLQNKTALVTGSGRNIGRSIALTLASMGANVVINSKENVEAANETADEIRKLGAKALVVMGDIGSETEVSKMVNEVRMNVDYVDIVINNGSLRRVQEFTSMTYDHWKEMINTDKTVIADIWVSKEENCFPMIQSGSAHNEMLLSKDQKQDKVSAEKGKILV